MTAEAQPVTVEIPGLRVQGLAWGSTDDPPVLALHGWLDNAGSFVALAPLLGSVRVVAIDLPGHGRSAHHPPSALYGFVDMVAEVVEVANALGWNRFSLLGHSLGAGLSSIVAGTVPERIRSVVLIDGLGPLTEEAGRAPERLAESIEHEAHRRGRAMPVYPDLTAAAERLVASRGIGEAAARQLAARGVRPTEGGVTWASDPALLVPSRVRLTESHVHAFLSRIACPVLVVHPDRGFAFDADAMQARREAVPDIEVVEVVGHHHIHMDAPGPIAGVIRPFFERHLGAR